MDKEEILKYARIFSTAKGDTHKIHFVNENKTINEPDLWKEVLDLIKELQKENEELSESNFHFLEINQKLIEEKPMIKKLTEKELNLLEEIDKLQKENEELKEEVEFEKNQRKLWRDNYYQQTDQIYNEKEMINKEAEIMRDNTIKIFTAQDIIKAKFQVIDKLLGDSNE